MMNILGYILISSMLMLLIFAGMAIGLFFGRPALKGSCGNLGSSNSNSKLRCALCGNQKHCVKHDKG